MTSAVASVGTTISIGGTQVQQVISIKGAEITQEQLDVTNLDSGRKEFISGFIDAGTIAFDVYWNSSAAQIALRNAFASRSTISGTVELNGGGGYTFTGLVERFSMGMETGAGITASFQCKLSSISFGLGTAQILVGGTPTGLNILVGGSATPMSFA